MKEIYSSWFPCLIGRLWATNAAPSIFCYFQTNWFRCSALFSQLPLERGAAALANGCLGCFLKKIWILSKQMCCQLVVYHFWLPLRLIPELNPNFSSSWLILPPISEHQIFLGVPVPDLRCCKSSQGFLEELGVFGMCLVLVYPKPQIWGDLRALSRSWAAQSQSSWMWAEPGLISSLDFVKWPSYLGLFDKI